MVSGVSVTCCGRFLGLLLTGELFVCGFAELICVGNLLFLCLLYVFVPRICFLVVLM